MQEEVEDYHLLLLLEKVGSTLGLESRTTVLMRSKVYLKIYKGSVQLALSSGLLGLLYQVHFPQLIPSWDKNRYNLILPNILSSEVFFCQWDQM